MPTRGEPFALDPARSALLVLDMQNDFVREGAPQGVPQARLVIGTIATARARRPLERRRADRRPRPRRRWFPHSMPAGMDGLGTLVNQTLTFVTNPLATWRLRGWRKPAHGDFPYPAKRGRSRQGRRAQASGREAPASHIPRRVCGRPRAARSEGTLVGGDPRVRAAGSAVAPVGGVPLGPQVGQPRQDGQSPRADRARRADPVVISAVIGRWRIRLRRRAARTEAPRAARATGPRRAGAR